VQQPIQEDFYFGEKKLEILLPGYQRREDAMYTGSVGAPYWAKIWPSAIALTRFLQEHPELIMGKQVLELAAGLGLPSLYVSGIAAHVLCSDYDPEAVDFIRKNIGQNQCQHISAACIDWKELPKDLKTDLLLLSDINYDPKDFDILHALIEAFLRQGTTILLATPQRLVAKNS